MLDRLLGWWRERRERVRGDAAELMLSMGEGAYAEARSRAADCRERRDMAGFRHWSRVASEIASRTGIEIKAGRSDWQARR